MPSSFLGLNYGHQFEPNTIDTYLDQVKKDLENFNEWGISALRIAYPVYDGPVGILMCQKIVEEALKYDFEVTWGVSTSGKLSAEKWHDFKEYMIKNIAPWAEQLKTKKLILEIGNEEEYRANNVTLTSRQIQNDVQGEYSDAVRNVFHGVVSYSVSGEHIRNNSRENIPGWINTGKGNLSKVGFNIYYDLEDLLRQVQEKFGKDCSISEWGTPEGFTGDEERDVEIVQSRMKIITDSDIDRAHFFTWKGGAFSVDKKWGICIPDEKHKDQYHRAIRTILNQYIDSTL